jgi:hypothetical protein
MTWTARKVCDTRKPSRVAGRSKAPSSSMNRSAYRPHPSLYPEISHRPVWNRDSGTRPAGTVQTTTPGRAPSSVGGR